MKNIIIFGASLFGEKVFNYYKNKKEISIIAFCDNDTSKHNQKLFDKNIISPDTIFDYTFDEIIIASSYEQEIKEQLIKMNIEKNKIKIFHTNVEEIQLKNDDLLLISQSLMLNIAELFNKNHIKYHIDHGTLLGLIRDNKILPWDIDIDFAILLEEKDKVIKLLDMYLITYKNKYSKVNNWQYFINEEVNPIDDTKISSMYITIVNNIGKNKNTIGLDIHIKYPDDKKLYWMVAQRKLSATKEFCFPTIDFEFQDVKLKIPNNANKYLTELYGDWKTPVKQWDYSQYSNIDSYRKYEK